MPLGDHVSRPDSAFGRVPVAVWSAGGYWSGTRLVDFMDSTTPDHEWRPRERLRGTGL